MNETPDGLVESVVALIGASVPLFAAIPGAWVSYQGFEEWHADPDDPTIFRRRSPDLQVLTAAARSAIEATGAWRVAKDALAADPVLGSRVDKLVGTALGSGMVQGEGLLHSAVESCALTDDPTAAVRATVNRWRDEIGAERLEVTMVVVTEGVDPLEPVNLSDTVVVRLMTDDEVANALRLGTMPTFPLGLAMASVHQRACIAVGHSLPRLAGDRITDRTDDATAFYSDLDQQIAASLGTLRLLGLSHVRERGRIMRMGEGAYSYSARWSAPTLAKGDPLGSPAEGEARRIFAAVRDGLTRRPQFAVALRRFNGSHEPRHEEDRLLDLWIAMEALFSPDEATEVTFRLSQNAANYVTVPGVSRRALFEWVKKGYGIRSSIAHGRDPGIKKLHRLSGEPMTSLGEASDDLREVVRMALLRHLLESDAPDFVGLSLRADVGS